jgi:hypothetical protein
MARIAEKLCAGVLAGIAFGGVVAKSVNSTAVTSATKTEPNFFMRFPSTGPYDASMNLRNAVCQTNWQRACGSELASSVKTDITDTTGIVLAPRLYIIGDECFVRIAHSDADHDALSINHAAEAALPSR